MSTTLPKTDWGCCSCYVPPGAETLRHPWDGLLTQIEEFAAEGMIVHLLPLEFNEALVGLLDPTGDFPYPRAVYSSERCIGVLAQDLPIEEAREHFEFNIQGAFFPPAPPLFIDLLEDYN